MLRATTHIHHQRPRRTHAADSRKLSYFVPFSWMDRKRVRVEYFLSGKSAAGRGVKYVAGLQGTGFWCYGLVYISAGLVL